MKNYLAFDIEIAAVIPDGLDSWAMYRPYGITCAATLAVDGTSTSWYGKTTDGGFADRMSRIEVIRLIEFLEEEVSSGKTLLTWNGVGFDLDVLAEESMLQAACSRLALNHVDMMFHLFCLKGFALGLDKAAKGMGLPGKSHDVGGANAANFWREGRQRDVLEYVHQDVVTTLGVALAVDKTRMLSWNSNRGLDQFLPFPDGWLTVIEAQRLPEPDTSWMDNPWKRSKFTGWISTV
jgi:hypothetical protein